MTDLYYLGCPVWACERWKGSLFTRHAPREKWLEQYSSVFNAVEGNSTFYGLPSLATVRRWATTARPGFRFLLKFPKTITHEKRLLGADQETFEFLQVLEILREEGCLGPAMLQLPGGFSGHHLSDLENYLRKLPLGFPVAVEVRNKDFFDQAKVETSLNDLLSELGMDRVIFDSRALHSGPPNDEAEEQSQARKPHLPVHPNITATHPVVRFIGRNDAQNNLPWVQEWARTLDHWRKYDVRPFIFTHTPDELHAPQFARLFHDQLRNRLGHLAPLNAWPGEEDGRETKQLQLF